MPPAKKKRGGENQEKPATEVGKGENRRENIIFLTSGGKVSKQIESKNIGSGRESNTDS